MPAEHETFSSISAETVQMKQATTDWIFLGGFCLSVLAAYAGSVAGIRWLLLSGTAGLVVSLVAAIRKGEA